MRLQLKSNASAGSTASPSQLPVRVTAGSRTTVVLVTELDQSVARDWAASKNTAFMNAVDGMGIAANVVVSVPCDALRRLPGGNVDAVSVLTKFPLSYGYLREELEAWITNRLCEVLYFKPREFDPGHHWARYGVDSAVALELVADFEDYLGTRLPQHVAECKGAADLATIVMRQLLVAGPGLPWWRSRQATAEAL